MWFGKDGIGMRVFICKGCGKIVELLKASKCPTKCCGEPMEELIPGAVDAALEKHVPAVSLDGSLVTVKVGSAAHPMLEEHFIGWIWLETDQGVYRKEKKAGDEPEAVFAPAPGEKAVAAYEYCNLHGLWKTEL